MARIPSNMLPLGVKLPDFTLYNTTSGMFENTLELSKNKNVLLMFICNHCPFVIHLHKGFQELYNTYKNKEIIFIAVNSNDVESYTEDSPDKMKSLFNDLNLDFPYLFDETQSLAKVLDAACTPDFYIFDKNQILTYRGRFDESRPGNGIPVTGDDIRIAIDDLLVGNKVSDYQKPSIGCNIKWK